MLKFEARNSLTFTKFETYRQVDANLFFLY